ncbi:ABC transporter substrate-binding protein [Streptomyces griseoaurantiacus]|uniref:ABC transporter substrate-binding protein n=1 Tax=Streptomyces griseoaurantiacus TaxID=68213 RepID=UPI0038270DB4
MNAPHTPRLPRRVLRPALVAALATVLLAGAACSSKSAGQSGGDGADGVRTGPGVSDSVIRLGALTDLSGPYATLGKSIVQAQQMWADETNADGGICGRKVRITVKDHGYDVQKAVGAYADLSANVVALPQVVGSPVVAALLDDLGRDHMLTFPQAWSADLLGKDSVQVVGTTYDVDMLAAVDHLLLTRKVGKGDALGHVYFEGDYGANALQGSTWAAERAGMKMVGQKIKATDTDLSAQVTALRKAGVKAVLISAGPAQTASLAGVAAARGLKVPIVSSAPGFAPQLLKTPAAKALEGMLHVVSAAPAVSADIPGVRRMVAAYGKRYPGSVVDSGVLSGYNAARLLGEDLKKACARGSLERADVVAAHRTQKHLDTGLGTPQDFSDEARPASLKTYVLKPDANAVGGLVNEEDAHEAPGVRAYLSSRR